VAVGAGELTSHADVLGMLAHALEPIRPPVGDDGSAE